MKEGKLVIKFIFPKQFTIFGRTKEKINKKTVKGTYRELKIILYNFYFISHSFFMKQSD